MRKYLLLAMMILLAAAVSAQQDIYFSEFMITDLDVSSKLDVKATALNYDLAYLNAKLYFFPEGYENQFVTVKSTEPKAVQEKGIVNFRWTDVREGTLEYRIMTQVKVKNDITRVKGKIKFPAEAPAELRNYTQSTEKVDSDSRGIINLANELAKGEDDLYVVTHKLASWVGDNVNYSLSTVTADVQQKASWVLSKRQGVCDEITVLFMALCRSLGIPAKFVSGTAYTESPLFPERWGAHGWAEVYFQGYGWVPFDITYGEYGWVDPTHIKLRESVDPSEPSVRFEWKGKYVDIESYPLIIGASIKEYGPRTDPDVRIIADSLKGSADFGSYDIIEAEVQNLKDYYTSTNLMIAKPAEIELLDSQNVHLLLKPGQSKKVYWRARISPELDSRYVYTFPVIVYTEKNVSSMARIVSSVKEPHYSKGEIDEYYLLMSSEERKSYSKEIILECTQDQDVIYTYESLSVGCSVQNKGNVPLQDVALCIKADCRSFDLGISQSEEQFFELSFDSAGKKDISSSVKNDEVFKAYQMSADVLDEPKVAITNVQYEKTMDYDSESKIVFTLSRDSYSVPASIRLSVRKGGKVLDWDITQIVHDEEFEVSIKGREFTGESMNISITAEHKDMRQRAYSSEESFSISLEELTLWQKIRISLNRMAVWIGSIFE